MTTDALQTSIDTPTPAASPDDGSPGAHSSSGTAALLAALRDHYLKPGELMPGGVLLTEVPAPDAPRRADALYVRFTRSRGYCIDGHELKISRSDWRRELTDPGKAEAWWPYCTRWWIVAPDPSIVPAAELPDGWGLMCPPRNGRRFRVIVPARVKEPTITLELLVELLKKLDTARINAVQDERQRAEQQHRVVAAQSSLLDSAEQARRRERLELLEEFEAATGLRLTNQPWRPGQTTPSQLADLVRPLLEAQRADGLLVQQLHALAERAAAVRRAADHAEASARAVQYDTAGEVAERFGIEEPR